MKFIELLDNVDENWSIDEKARFLYVELNKIVTYDERFIYSKNPELLWSIYNRDVDIEKDEDTKVICYSLCKIYMQLLEKLNIRAELIYSPSKTQTTIGTKDVSLVYWNEKGQKRFTNIAADIERCKFGLKTGYFCVGYHNYENARDAIRMHSQELREIDEKIGYVKGNYSDVAIALLSAETKDNGRFLKFLKSQGIKTERMTSSDLLKAKMMYITRFIKYRDQTAGPNELIKFYKRLFSKVLNNRDEKNFLAFEFIKSNGNEIELKSILQIQLSEGPVYYIYSKEKQGYEQILDEELLEEIEGFHEKKGKKLMIETQSVVQDGEEPNL